MCALLAIRALGNQTTSDGVHGGDNELSVNTTVTMFSGHDLKLERNRILT